MKNLKKMGSASGAQVNSNSEEEGLVLGNGGNEEIKA